jgi:peptidoglycan/xylan/chitin deacetylase (PgdA/CDA1 family)
VILPKGRYQKCNNDRILVVLVAILAVALVLSILSSFFVWHWELVIDINTMPFVVEYDQPIPTPRAYMRGKIFYQDGFEVDVFSQQDANLHTIGTHTNVYTAKCLFYRITETHNFLVVDTTAPVITLEHKDDYYTLPGKEYVEEGYSAYDAYDGDITDRVEVFQNGDTITYFVQDSSGNYTSVERTIYYDDPEPPTIELIGDSEVFVSQNTPYVDTGVIATDNCDGDLTNAVLTHGEVDTQKIGTYVLTYVVSDNFHNETSITRTIHVVANQPVNSPGSAENIKTIYLTFDDGPSQYTDDLLNVLAQYNVQATFFVVGNGDYVNLIKDIVDDGHSIGIHTLSHDYQSIYSSEQAFLDELYEMQNIILEQSGVKTYLMRFPGGSSNTISKKYCPGIMTTLTKKVEELGFRYFDWNVGSGDTDGLKTKEAVFQRTIQYIQQCNNAIVLQHDTKGYSVEAVENIIKWGLENGYVFAPLDMSSPTVHHTVAN